MKMDNPGDIFIRASWVQVDVTVKGEDPQRTATDRRYSISIDQYGYAEIERYPGKLQHDNRSTHPNFEADRAAQRDAWSELVDAEILTWKAIGPEDSELFASDELEKRIRPALDGLGDRQVWHQEEPIVRPDGPETAEGGLIGQQPY
jgi:hypothetical protein